MHEASLAENLISLLREELQGREGVSEVDVVRVRIGEMSCVNEESFQFAFRMVTEETEFVETELEIEKEPVKIKCEKCGAENTIEPGRLCCPECDSRHTKVKAGDDFYLISMECR